MGSFDVEVNVEDDELKKHVKDNFDPVDVYGEKDLREYIVKNYYPEQVFYERELTLWALENNFSKEDA